MRWTLPLVLGMLVAGCADGGEGAADEPLVDADSFDDFELQDTAPKYGVIRGVVVDATYAPVAGALVELLDHNQNVTTAETGVFAFKDLVPGTYFLKIGRDRYETTQASVEVVANVPEPELVRVLMQRIPGTEPRVVAGVFDGYMTCSLRIPAAGFNDGCGVFGDIVLGSTARAYFTYEGTGIQWWQGEMTWSPSGPTAERMCFRVYADTLAGNDVCTVGPILQTMDRKLIEANDVESGEEFDTVAYPDHYAADVSGNVVLQQSFKLAHHAFYNFVPVEGWAFSKDGEPVLPP